MAKEVKAAAAPKDKTPVVEGETVKKSIVDPKYRANMNKDWMAGLISEFCVKDNAISIDALTNFAQINFLNVDKFATQKDTHGFPGRYRMTVGNMLRAVAKKRHGLFVPKGSKSEWREAPAEWLKEKDAPEAATHDRKGAKIKVEPKKEEAPTAKAA